MTALDPFRPDRAEDALPRREGDFMLPICLADLGVLMGEAVADLAPTTIEGQRVWVPMGHQAPSDLRVAEALEMLQAGDGDVVQ